METQEIRDARAEFVFIDGPDDEVVDEFAQMARGRTVGPGIGQQEKRQQDGFLGAAAGADFGLKLLERRAVDDGQVETLLNEVIAVGGNDFVHGREPIFQQVPIAPVFHVYEDTFAVHGYSGQLTPKRAFDQLG